MDFRMRLGCGVPVDTEALLERVIPGAEWHTGENRSDSVNAALAGKVAERGKAVTVVFDSVCGARGLISHAAGSWPGVLNVSFGDREVPIDTLDSLATMGGHAGWYPPALGQARDSLVRKFAGGPGRESWALSGVGELHWFGSDLVEFMGGDDVFASLPEGWAEKTEFGQWRVVGLDRAEDPDGFNHRHWSTRERAVIDHLGRHFFADMDAGRVPRNEIPVPAVSYDVYLWRDDELQIVSPDGSSRSLGSQSRPADEAAEPEPAVGEVMASRAKLFEQEMAGRPLGEMLASDDEDPVYWVGEWVAGQSMFDAASAVKLVGAWLGEQVVGRVDGVQWSGAPDNAVLQAGDATFDPFAVVQQWIAGEEGALRLPAFVTSVRKAMSGR